jgi:predicted lipase
MKTHHIFLLAMTCILFGCDRVTSTASYDAEVQEQLKRTRVQMDDYDRQTKRADVLYSKAEQQYKRFDKILDKWEEQARRQDAIISAREKQQGIKK